MGAIAILSSVVALQPLTRLEQAVDRAGNMRETRMSLPERRRGGVVHTPPRLARFAINRAHEIARHELGWPGGLGDPGTTLLDPACGPGAFLAAALEVLGREGRQRSAPTTLLGFDRDAAALRTARRLLGPVADKHAWPLRLRVRDTLSLEPRSFEPSDLAVQRLAIVGNPPWGNQRRARDAQPTADLMQDFRRDAGGVPLRERRVGVLADDYVHFFRWAAEAARQAPAGAVVALVTNASFLDGRVHRGMRWHLMQWFDGVEIVDLGGGALVKQATAPRDRDENLFGVRPPVALTMAWRRGGSVLSEGSVRYRALRGSAQSKLATLEATPCHANTDAAYAQLRPTAPLWLWVPRRIGSSAWRDGLCLAEAMPFHREGVQTNRDAALVDTHRGRLLERLHAFARGSRRADLARLWQPRPHYQPELAQQAVRDALGRDPVARRGEVAMRLAYRPFSPRWFAPIPHVCHRPRPALLDAVAHSSFVLLSVRQDRGHAPWAHMAVARHVPDNSFFSTRSSCRTRAFCTHRPTGEPNLATEVADRIEARVEAAVSVEDFAHYAFAVLAAPAYRAACEDELRSDYPKLPLPPNARAWSRLVGTGAALAEAFTRRAHMVPLRQPLLIGHGEVARAPKGLESAWLANASAVQQLLFS